MRWVGRILGGLLALALLAYLAMNAYAWVSARHNKNVARERLTGQLSTATPAASEHKQRVAEALGAPQHGWLVQRCDVKTDDSGWMVQNYRQECVLSAVDAYAVDSLAQARRLVAGAPAQLVGVPSDDTNSHDTNSNDTSSHDTNSGGCVSLAARADDGDPRAVASTSLAATVIVPQPADDGYWCGHSFQPSPYRPEQTLGGEHVTLDATRSWLLVSRAEQLGDDSIGCSRWSVLLCSEPSGLPVFGQAPKL